MIVLMSTLVGSMPCSAISNSSGVTGLVKFWWPTCTDHKTQKIHQFVMRRSVQVRKQLESELPILAPRQLIKSAFAHNLSKYAYYCCCCYCFYLMAVFQVHLGWPFPLWVLVIHPFHKRTSQSVSQSINTKFVGRHYTTCPGAPPVVNGKHDQKLHSWVTFWMYWCQ